MGLPQRVPDDVLWQLPITGSAPDPQIPKSAYVDINISNIDTIEFTNNTSYPVSIVFTKTSGNVFTDIPMLSPGASSAQTPIGGINNLTVDYTITNLNANLASNPCGIQIGTGPLRVNILASQTNPDPVAIP